MRNWNNFISLKLCAVNFKNKQVANNIELIIDFESSKNGKCFQSFMLVFGYVQTLRNVEE